MARSKELLHVGIGGHVVALDVKTGEILWNTRLKGKAALTDFVTVSLRGKHVYAAANGELWCLDAASGEPVWHNKLKGFGLGFVTLAGDDASGSAVAAAAAATAAAASAG